jgi:hypothetical protein
MEIKRIYEVAGGTIMGVSGLMIATGSDKIGFAIAIVGAFIFLLPGAIYADA